MPLADARLAHGSAEDHERGEGERVARHDPQRQRESAEHALAPKEAGPEGGFGGEGVPRPCASDIAATGALVELLRFCRWNRLVGRLVHLANAEVGSRFLNNV